MIQFKDNFIGLFTKETTLVFEIKNFDDPKTPFNKNKKFVTLRYYGKKKELASFEENKPLISPYGSCEDYNWDYLITSNYGDANNKEPSIIIHNADGTFVNRFFFQSAKVIKGAVEVKGPHTRKVQETLDITEYDEVSCLELHTYYSLLDDSDVITVKRELKNLSDKDISFSRLFSLEMPFRSNHLKVSTYDGSWLFERTRHITDLTSGVFVNQSLSGSSSHKHNPYIGIYDACNDIYFAFNMVYSGNYKELVEIDALRHGEVMMGINDFALNYPLKAHDSFMTPEAVMTVAESEDRITSVMHHFVLNHIVNPAFAYKDRPILFNNWEGTGMNINEKTLLEMAEIAEKVGIEQFVMDDGWFKNRKTDEGGLGDWSVDEAKFPDGLASFVKKVRGFHLKFGIWVEPEMICIHTDLFKAHPEYACIIPGREPIERRYQLFIDMTNPEVVNYLYDCLSKVFDEIHPDYVKWDYNRIMSDVYSSSGTPSGEFFHRFIMGTYGLIERLQKRYPEILFESCASGGGRFDLGMIYYMPQTWGSDDTNTYCRSFIACGTLTAYPQSTYGAHVSRDGNPDTRRGDGRSSLEDRFNLHSIGAFGYEFDFRTFGETELDIMKKQVAYYKEHRHLLQFGQYHVMDNIFDDANYYSYDVVSPDQEEAIMVAIQIEKEAPDHHYVLKGLNPDYRYHIKMRKQYNILPQDILSIDMSGKDLMDKGLDLGSLFAKTTDSDKYPGCVCSRMLYLKKI